MAKCQLSIYLSSETDLSRNQAIQNMPVREDVPCHSTSETLQAFGALYPDIRNIIGNWCIIKQKCLCNYEKMSYCQFIF
jgi:hypothetical protein